MCSLFLKIAVVASFATLTASQYFPPTPEGLTVVKSKFVEGVSISYKEVSIVQIYSLVLSVILSFLGTSFAVSSLWFDVEIKLYSIARSSDIC